MCKNRIVSKYSSSTQLMYRALCVAKMRHLKHPSDPELQDRYLSLDRLMEEQFDKEDAMTMVTSTGKVVLV